MPWTTGDVESHAKGLSTRQKRVWVAVANNVLKRCLAENMDAKECDASAIKQANATAQESGELLADVFDEIEEAVTSQQEARDAAIETDFVPLRERALRKDKSAQVKIIAPGWGSSGHYSPEMLERDGPRVFTKGLKMFWNHASATEEAERPEGDLRNLAGELLTDARYLDKGPSGPGLYADAKVFDGYSAAVEELAPHIGVSIRGFGKAKEGTADGRKGKLIEQLVGARSVDFVTEPGAGGQIVQLFESARERQSPEVNTVEEKEAQALREANEDFTKKLQESEAALAKEREASARLREGVLIGHAAVLVADRLAESKLPDVTKERLAKTLAVNPPAKDGELDKDALEKRIGEAVKDELDYLQKVSGGPIRGLSSGDGDGEWDASKATERRTETFKRMGLAESAAKAAAAGRI